MKLFEAGHESDVISPRTFGSGNLQRVSIALVLLALIPATALAQYPGGASPSYGSKGAVIGGVVAGAAVGGGLLYWKLHSRTRLQGCLSDQADRLVDEKNNRTYHLSNKQNQTLKPGERVQLSGKLSKDSSGEATFEIQNLSKDLGQCTVTTAERHE